PRLPTRAGLSAEEPAPHPGRPLGNSPQASPHLALITAAIHVIRAEEQEAMARMSPPPPRGTCPRPSPPSRWTSAQAPEPETPPEIWAHSWWGRKRTSRPMSCPELGEVETYLTACEPADAATTRAVAGEPRARRATP